MKFIYVSWLINRLSTSSTRPNKVASEKTAKRISQSCRGGIQTNDDRVESFRKDIKNGKSQIKKKFRCISWLVSRCSLSPSKQMVYEDKSAIDISSYEKKCGLKSEDNPKEYKKDTEGYKTETLCSPGSVLPTNYYEADDFYQLHTTSTCRVHLHAQTPTSDCSWYFSPLAAAELQKDSGEYLILDSNSLFPNPGFLDSFEQNWENGTLVGPSNPIISTLQLPQTENNVVLEQDQYYPNYNNVEQNNNLMVRHVSEGELHTTNKCSDTDHDKTRPDTPHISCNATLNEVDNPRTSKINIGLEVLERHFKMSMGEAAESLNVSKSTLKRICRRNGIQRWPYRCKRKNVNHEQRPNPKNMNKLATMNNKDQAQHSAMSRGLVVSPLGEPRNSSTNVTIKATYGDDIVKFPFSTSSALNDLKEKMCWRLGIKIPLKLKCIDNDGDLVLIACDDSLHELFGSRLSSLVDHNNTFDFSVFRDPI